MSKGELLMSEGGAYFTMPRADAERVRPRLEEALDITVQLERMPNQSDPLPGEDNHCNWTMLRIAANRRGSFQREARLYVKAWQQGGTDALDAHYQRPSYLAYLAEANAHEGGQGVPLHISEGMRQALERAASPTGLGSWDAAAGVLGALKRRGWVELKVVPGDRRLDGEPRYFTTCLGDEARKS